MEIQQKRRGRPPGPRKTSTQQTKEPKERKTRTPKPYADVLRKRGAVAIAFLERHVLPILPQLAPSADLTHVADAIRDLVPAWEKITAHKSFDGVYRIQRSSHRNEVTVGMVVQLVGAGFVRAFHTFGEKAARGPWAVEAIHGRLIVLSSKSIKGAKLSENRSALTDDSSLAARRHDRLVQDLLGDPVPTAAAPADNSLV